MVLTFTYLIIIIFVFSSGHSFVLAESLSPYLVNLVVRMYQSWFTIFEGSVDYYGYGLGFFLNSVRLLINLLHNIIIIMKGKNKIIWCSNNKESQKKYLWGLLNLELRWPKFLPFSKELTKMNFSSVIFSNNTALALREYHTGGKRVECVCEDFEDE